jgi:hypothetical protein
VRRELQLGPTAVRLRVGHAYSRGPAQAGSGDGAAGLSAEASARFEIAPALAARLGVGAASFVDVDPFLTLGAGLHYTGTASTGSLGYHRLPAVREAGTMTALHAAAVLHRLHLAGSYGVGRWRTDTDMQVQRFRAAVGDADRYTAMVRAERELGGSGMAAGALVRGIFSSGTAPVLPGRGRLYWTPDHYLAPALSISYGALVADGWWLGLRASPGYAFIDELSDAGARFSRSRTATLEGGLTVGYRAGPWSVDLAGDWGGALPGGYSASAVRLVFSRLGGSP